MPLGPLLLWTALLSSATVLWRTWRIAGRPGPFAFIALVPFVLTVLTTLLAPEVRTALVFGSWLLLIFVPALLFRQVSRLQMQQRYGAARLVLLPALLVHPFAPWRRLPRLLGALDRAQRGDVERARAELERQLADPAADPGTRFAIRTFLARLDGAWESVLPWLDNPAFPEAQRFGLRLRVFGETGRLAELMAAVRTRRARQQPFPVTDLLAAFAFGGCPSAVQWLVAPGSPLSGLGAEAKSLWIATAQQAAGAVETARAPLTTLAASGHDDIRRAAARRLATPARVASEALTPADSQLLLALAAELQRVAPVVRTISLSRSYATLALIAANVAVFAAEVILGGQGGEDQKTLAALGALWPEAVFDGHEYWRLLASTFLHFGPIHLAMNMFGLAILGPRVEAWLGRVKMVVVYVLAGVGAMASALVFMRLGWMRDEFLVGASGSIMAMVGALGVLQLKAFQTQRSAVTRAGLMNVGLILALQAAFNLSTPQVSFAAHASGVVIGALLTAAIEPLGRRG